MLDSNPIISIITLNINNLNVPIKTRIVKVDQKPRQLYAVYKKLTGNVNTHTDYNKKIKKYTPC